MLNYTPQSSFAIPYFKFTRKVLSVKPNKDLTYITQLVEKGIIKPIIEGPYRFEEIPKLIQYFGDGKHQGKIVVEITK